MTDVVSSEKYALWRACLLEAGISPERVSPPLTEGSIGTFMPHTEDESRLAYRSSQLVGGRGAEVDYETYIAEQEVWNGRPAPWRADDAKAAHL